MKNKKLEDIGLLILPSGLGTIVSMIIAIITVGMTILSELTKDGDLKYGLMMVHDLYMNGFLMFSNFVDNNAFISNVPLMLLWGAVGFVVYETAVHVIAIFADTQKLIEEMDYVHASRRKLLMDAGFKVALRMFALLGLVLLFNLTSDYLLPYVTSAVIIALFADILPKVGYILLAMALVVVTVQFYVVLLRLLALKPRLFD